MHLSAFLQIKTTPGFYANDIQFFTIVHFELNDGEFYKKYCNNKILKNLYIYLWIDSDDLDFFCVFV